MSSTKEPQALFTMPLCFMKPGFYQQEDEYIGTVNSDLYNILK